MRKSIGLFLLGVFFSAVGVVSSFAAGSSVTWTGPAKIGPYDSARDLVVYTAAIVSDDAAGTASGTVSIRGTILKVEAFDGATTPTTAWDFTLKNALGVDIIGGVGANVPTTGTYNAPRGTVSTAADTVAFADGTLTLAASAMGNSKTGTIRLYVAK